VPFPDVRNASLSRLKLATKEFKPAVLRPLVKAFVR